MASNRINKLKKHFFNKFVSEGRHNNKYSFGQIVAELVTLTRQNMSIEEATAMSPDTLGRRIDVGSNLDAKWFCEFNRFALELVKPVTLMNQRVRWGLLIDGSDDAYFGDIRAEKEHIAKNKLPDFLATYRKVKGSTGSFKYLVIALSSKVGTFPLFVTPIIKGNNLLGQIEQVLMKIKTLCKEIIILADREYGHGRFIKMLQDLKIAYCVRLKGKGALDKRKKKLKRFVWHSFSWK